MTKPFAFEEFVARVEALLRRGDLQRHDPVLRVADLTLDPMTRQVRRGDRPIELTRKEYGLLRYLMENAGTVLSRSQLLNANWGYNFDPGTKVVDVYIRYLRIKIDEGEEVALDPDGSRRGLRRRPAGRMIQPRSPLRHVRRSDDRESHAAFRRRQAAARARSAGASRAPRATPRRRLRRPVYRVGPAPGRAGSCRPSGSGGA